SPGRRVAATTISATSPERGRPSEACRAKDSTRRLIGGSARAAPTPFGWDDAATSSTRCDGAIAPARVLRFDRQELSVATPRIIAHPSVADRKARGADARIATPLETGAGWAPAKDRFDPVALLEEQNRTREPDLVPVRHGRMAVSPFTFYRGAAKIMAADLAATPTAGLDAQLCGDAHLSNFGGYASPERKLVFDLNDF